MHRGGVFPGPEKFDGTPLQSGPENYIEHRTIIDIAPSRDQYDVARLLARQPLPWRNAIEYGTLDLSALYRAVLRIALPHAHLVADPFHVVKQANEQLDRVRRRVQWESKGHRGRKTDPLYRIRRRLLTGEEKLREPTVNRVQEALRLGDPHGEVILAWRVKEAVRHLYHQPDLASAQQHFIMILSACSRSYTPLEIQT